MACTTDRNGLLILNRQECLDLLGGPAVGRLAYVGDGVARAIPLNVVLDGERLLFRLGTGGALAAIEGGQVVTLEIDDYDGETRGGWSVTVTGRARQVPAALAAHAGDRCSSWLRGRVGRLFELGTDRIEGRGLHAARFEALDPHHLSEERP